MAKSKYPIEREWLEEMHTQVDVMTGALDRLDSPRVKKNHGIMEAIRIASATLNACAEIALLADGAAHVGWDRPSDFSVYWEDVDAMHKMEVSIGPAENARHVDGLLDGFKNCESVERCVFAAVMSAIPEESRPTSGVVPVLTKETTQLDLKPVTRYSASGFHPNTPACSTAHCLCSASFCVSSSR